MEQVKAPNTKKQWYAWVIFAICFLMIFVALGFGSSTKGTFLTAITGSLGLKRSQFTIADSMRYITMAIMSVFLGKTVDKIGLRFMALFGFLFLVCSFLLYGFAKDIVLGLFCESGSSWELVAVEEGKATEFALTWRSWVPDFLKGVLPYIFFYMGGAFLGAGLCWTTTSMVGNIVQNWFSNGKGTIMGILLASNGLGGVASEFIVTKIVYGIDGGLSYVESNWQQAYFIIAGMFVVVGLLAFLLIRNKPEDIGTVPMWQDKKAKAKRKGLDWEGYEEKQIFRQPWFYISGICVFMIGFVLQSSTNVAKPFMYDLGFDKNYVVFVFASHSLVLMAAKTLAGIGYDTIGMKKVFLVCASCAFVALTALFVAGFFGPEVPVFAWIYSIVSSFGMPLETVIIPLLVSYLFGKKAYKKVLGYYIALNTAGYALGVPLVNLAYDIQGTYQWIILVIIVMLIIATVVQEISMTKADLERKKLLEGKNE